MTIKIFKRQLALQFGWRRSQMNSRRYVDFATAFFHPFCEYWLSRLRSFCANASATNAPIGRSGWFVGIRLRSETSLNMPFCFESTPRIPLTPTYQSTIRTVPRAQAFPTAR